MSVLCKLFQKSGKSIAGSHQESKELVIQAMAETSLGRGSTTPQKVEDSNTSSGINQMLIYWERFYREILDMEICVGNIIIPPRKPGFDQLIIVGRKLTHEKCYKTIKELGGFGCYIYSPMNRDDGPFTWHERVPVTTYALWIRGSFGIEKDLIGVTADEVEQRGMYTMTSLERLLLSVVALSSRSKLSWENRPHHHV
jgi:hypothetical protein